MALASGTRVGAYEILSPLGAGGMGEVYRARDTRLGRDVALKILPAGFALDPDRLARFKREAQILASLNHPNIAAIYGSEESDGVRALVLELVDGDTLADRIARGALSVDDALPLANQIADALEAAHEAGIVHRDLKPANIKVRPDGTVKVLDFGLAKALGPPEGGHYVRQGDVPQGDVRQGVVSGFSRTEAESPPITTPAMMTGVGVMLGTAAYMSPEQAKGRPADKRSDIWAFGCVLFEMLAGKRAFDGEDATDVIAAVVRGEPDWHALPRAVPPHIRDIIKRCLVKDRKARLPDVSVVRFLMNAEPVRADVSSGRATLPAPVAAAIAVAVAVVAVVGTWSLVRPALSPPPQPARFTLSPSSTFEHVLHFYGWDVP